MITITAFLLLSNKEKHMLMIAHRGNLEGPRPNLENRTEYIQKALDAGFYVEIDVWVKNRVITLGHNEGVYPCQVEFLTNDKILCHAKNFEAIEFFNSHKDIHWFWHDKDACTLTSKGWVWAFPHNRIEGSILNQPEFNQKWNPEEAISQYRWYISNGSFLGVCSDYVQLLKEVI